MSSPSLPSHLVSLPGNKEWALWRWAGLRGTGFPAAGVLNLASPAVAAAADQVLRAEATLAETAGQINWAANQALDELRQAGEWNRSELRKPLLAVLSAVKKGKVPRPVGVASVDGAGQQLQLAQRRLEEAHAAFAQTYTAAEADTSATIRQIAADPRFREAAVWQNRHTVHTGIASLLRQPNGTGRTSQTRQHEELVASYYQRYTLKNDTIGFFGPVGWATLDDAAPLSCLHPGSDLLATRTVYFEGWGIDALAARISQEPALRPWLAPRRLPHYHLQHERLYLPERPPITLPTMLATVLAACNGRETAREIAARLVNTPGSGLQQEAEVYQMLAQLEQWGLIAWAVEVPLATHPEQALRQRLEEIGEPTLRQWAIGLLNQLEHGRQAVAAAAGDADRLEQALAGLEQTFTQLTGAPPTQAHGEVYGARTLVYEDCRRDVEMRIGGDVLATLAPPLSLLLTSVRWFTAHLAEQVEQVCRQVYHQLVAQTGSDAVEAILFAHTAEVSIFDLQNGPIPRTRAEFQQRWHEILELPDGVSRVAYDSERLRARVAACFAAPKAGWQYGRYHSPDLLLAAPSLEAIQRGKFQAVLGELHLASNTLGASLWLAQHPAAHELLQAVSQDLPEPMLIYDVPKNWPSVTCRTRAVAVPDGAWRLVFGKDPASGPAARTIPIGSCVVREVDGRLRLRTRDHQHCLDLVESLANMLTLMASDLRSQFDLARDGFHAPRVTIDRLVISRETWLPQVQALDFAHLKDEASRFLALRRWAQQQQLPRFVFAFVPTEKKPFYVDFDSPIYANIFAKAVRRAARAGYHTDTITLSEMLPRPDQVWLCDAQQRRYTSELRLVAYDLVA